MAGVAEDNGWLSGALVMAMAQIGWGAMVNLVYGVWRVASSPLVGEGGRYSGRVRGKYRRTTDDHFLVGLGV